MTNDDLVIHQRGAEPRRLGLYGQVYRIGRDPKGEVVIPHPTVSKRHALLQRRGRTWLLSDAGSTSVSASFSANTCDALTSINKKERAAISGG